MLALARAHPDFSLELELLCSLMPAREDQEVLDIGEGPGALRSDLARDLFDSSRQDGMPELIAAANRRYLLWLLQRGLKSPSEFPAIEGFNMRWAGVTHRLSRALRVRREHWPHVERMASEYMQRVYG